MMSELTTRCIIVGASHAGVTCAFTLRQQGYDGEIVMVDADPLLPYHRPPLSKAFLLNQNENVLAPLKAEMAYDKADIQLLLGKKVDSIDANNHQVTLCHVSEEHDESRSDTHTLAYTSLVLATGATPIVPLISGIESIHNGFVLRTAHDAIILKRRIAELTQSTHRDSPIDVVVIGAGYIGLEAAASLRKVGANVTVLERESRILSRVASSVVSDYVRALHNENDVEIMTNTLVHAIEKDNDNTWVCCNNKVRLHADIILLGVGVKVDAHLATSAGLAVSRHGINVNSSMQTSNASIWAIGDCTVFPHVLYNRDCHIESVQNALDQAKVAAASICGNPATYYAVPWFWSDQFNAKLQMVGLSEGADTHITRQENNGGLSVWHFVEEQLICVEAINSPKAYVLGGRWISQQQNIDRHRLADPECELKTCVN